MSKLDEFAEKARKLAAEHGEGVKDALGALPDSADWEELRKMAGNLGEDAAVFVRKYPLQSVLGAAALGFVLGASLGRRR
jgi:ElaB/YqjD/DUF883 family membrane-anchored ribosome-binding protein